MDKDRVKFRIFYAIVVSSVFLLIFISISNVFGASWGSFPNPALPRTSATYDVLVGGTFEAAGTPGSSGLVRRGSWAWIDSNKCKYYVAGSQNKLYIYVAPVDEYSIIECCGYQMFQGYRYTSSQTWSQSAQWNYTSVATSTSSLVSFTIDNVRWYRIVYGTLDSRATQPIYTNVYIWDDNLYNLGAQPALEYLLANYEPNQDYNVTSYDESVPTFRTVNILNTSAKSTAYDTTEGLIFAANNLGKYISDSTVEVGEKLSDGTTYDTATYKLQFAFSVQSRIKNENSYMFWLDKYLGDPYTYQSDILTYANLLSHNSLSNLNLIGYLNGDSTSGYLGGLKYFLKNSLGGTRGVYYYDSITMYVRVLRLSDNHYGNWTIATYTPAEDGEGGSYQVINAKPIGDGLAYIQTLQQTSSGQGAEKDFNVFSEYSYTSTSSNGDVAYSSDSAYGGNSFKDFSNISDDIKQVPIIITTVFSFLPPQILSLIGICFALLVIFFILKFLQ